MSTKTNHIGREIWFNETEFKRTLRKYNAFVMTVEPISRELIRMGLKPLDRGSLNALLAKNYSSFIADFESAADLSINNLPFIYRPSSKDAVKNGAKSLVKFLESFENQLSGGDEFADCPILDGHLIVTEEFENELRERFKMRIKTAEGSLYYEAFLRAQQAIQEMSSLGAKAGYHYDFDIDLGLRILNVCE